MSNFLTVCSQCQINCTLRPHNEGFDNHRKLIFWALTWQKKKKKASHICFLHRGAAGDRRRWFTRETEVRRREGCWGWDPELKERVRSSFCLPKVYPVVYTPRQAAAPRAEGATLRSKMNMWHIWLFFFFSPERKRGPRRLAAGGNHHVPCLSWCIGSSKGYQLLR